jgi:outer membrane cobalamin receptor
MNIVSGKAIEVSPDLTVANVMQRVSGVSIERNSNGDGQYAILRGMDKRYNYTLVNGVSKFQALITNTVTCRLIFSRLICSTGSKFSKTLPLIWKAMQLAVR